MPILIAVSVVLICTLILIVIGSQRERPLSVVKKFGVHFTPNSVFTEDQIEKAISSFIDVWFSAYPQDYTKFKKALKDLDIIWYPKRLKIGEEQKEILAYMENPNCIHLWIGPKVKGTRRITYTGLLDQMAKLALLVNDKEPETSKPEIRKLLAQVRDKIL